MPLCCACGTCTRISTGSLCCHLKRPIAESIQDAHGAQACSQALTIQCCTLSCPWFLQMYSSAQKFLVSQFGLSTFTYAEGVYTSKTFNFNIYPRSFQSFDKRFVCQASSLEFLTQHKFDFNKFIYQGVGYLSLQQQEAMREVRPPEAMVEHPTSAE